PPQDSTLLFFSNLTAPPQPYPLPLHDALPIFAIEDQRSRVPKRPRRLEHGTRSVAVEQPLRQPRSVHPALNGAVERGMDGSRLRSEEHTSELQSRGQLVCRLLLEKKKKCFSQK